jgi:hypothetical protein
VGDSEVRMSGHATQRGRGPGGLFGFAASAIILLRYIFCVSQSEYEKKKQEGTHCSSSHRSLSLEVPGSFASTNGRSRSMNFCVSVRMWTLSVEHSLYARAPIACATPSACARETYRSIFGSLLGGRKSALQPTRIIGMIGPHMDRTSSIH